MKYYASFNQETYTDPANAGYTRVPYGDGISNYTSTDRATLISRRAALSSAMLAQLYAANQRSTNQIVTPLDAMSVSGASLQSSNVYSSAAGYLRSAHPTVANSTPASPADPWSITKSLYDDAVSTMDIVVSRIGIYAQLGPNTERTKFSLLHDADLRYFYWDDGLSTEWGNPTIEVSPVPAYGSTELSLLVRWGVSAASLGEKVKIRVFHAFPNDYEPVEVQYTGFIDTNDEQTTLTVPAGNSASASQNNEYYVRLERWPTTSGSTGFQDSARLLYYVHN